MDFRRFPAPTPTQPLAYTVNELPGLTKIGRTMIFQAIKEGRLKARKNGKRTLILATDLQEFLDGLELKR